jgi:homoserine O-acetyltransferase/O-succinyltransferase
VALVVLAGPGSAGAQDARASLLDPADPSWAVPAPDTFRARFKTTRGDFVVEAVRAWAPLAVDRFWNLVRHGYYDDARFHRVVPGFIVQWGIAGDPTASAVWLHRPIPDETSPGVGNVRGTIAFAFTAKDTRATQVFVSLADNTRLDAQGFRPFGRVVGGMDVVDGLYGGYGESSGGGMRAAHQDSLVARGNAYLDAAFPRLDRLIRATIESH